MSKNALEFSYYNKLRLFGIGSLWPIVGEPKSSIVQKRTFFAPERYTAGILYTGSLYSAWYETTV